MTESDNDKKAPDAQLHDHEHDHDHARPSLSTRPVDCQALVELLGDYVDDQLPADQKAVVDGHMHQCAPCMAFLRQYRFAPEAVRAHLLEKVPIDLEDRLLSFLRKRTGKKDASGC
jgi:hypothetical protein